MIGREGAESEAKPNPAGGTTHAVIETERLLLRRLDEGDAAFILDLLNQPSFLENIGDRGVRTLEDARAYIRDGAVASYARHGFGLYAVVVKESGALAGICGLVKRDGLDDVDLGFAFLPQHWSKGFGVESAAAAKRHAARDVGLKRLVAITSLSNVRSIAVLEKIGFTFERVIRLPHNAEDLRLFAVTDWS
jgi:RimJ/RimL family protein N-acetyltransferase